MLQRKGVVKPSVSLTVGFVGLESLGGHAGTRAQLLARAAACVQGMHCKGGAGCESAVNGPWCVACRTVRGIHSKTDAVRSTWGPKQAAPRHGCSTSPPPRRSLTAGTVCLAGLASGARSDALAVAQLLARAAACVQGMHCKGGAGCESAVNGPGCVACRTVRRMHSKTDAVRSPWGPGQAAPGHGCGTSPPPRRSLTAGTVCLAG